MICAIITYMPSSTPLACEHSRRPSWCVEWEALPEGDVVFRCARGYIFVVWRQQQNWAFRNCGDCCCCYMSCNFCLALHYDAQAGQKKVCQQFTSQGMLMTCTQLVNILCFLFNWQTLWHDVTLIYVPGSGWRLCIYVSYLWVMQHIGACAIPVFHVAFLLNVHGLLCAVWPETKQDVWTWHISANHQSIFRACSDWAPAVKEYAFGRGWAQ